MLEKERNCERKIKMKGREKNKNRRNEGCKKAFLKRRKGRGNRGRKLIKEAMKNKIKKKKGKKQQREKERMQKGKHKSIRKEER